MRYRFFLLCLCGALSACLANCQVDTGNKLSAAELKRILESGEGVFLLDVRTPIELKRDGMIQGAVNIPLNELKDRWKEVPRNKRVITFCVRARRAKIASDLLASHGYKPPETAALEDWKAAHYPLVYPAEKKTDASASPTAGGAAPPAEK